jgi:hypothetical protein
MTRSIANQEFLLGAETTKGTAQTTTMRRYGGLRAKPGWSGDAEPFRGRPSKTATAVQLPDEIGRWSAEGVQCFNALGAVAASRIAIPTTDQPDAGGAPTAYRHVFDLNPDAEDNYRTYTLQWGDSVQALQAVYAAFHTFGLSVQRGQLGFETGLISRMPQTGASLAGTNEVQRITITGSPTGGNFTLTFQGATTTNIPHNATATQVRTALEALPSIGAGNVSTAGGPLPGSAVDVTFVGRLARKNVPLMTAAHSFTGGTSPNISVTEQTAGNPTDIAAIPIPSNRYDIYADDTVGALGTTKLLACYQANVTLGEKFDPDAPINATITSYAHLLEKEEQDYGVEFRLGFDATAISLINTFQAGSLKFFRWQVEGPTIGAAVKYLLRFDAAIFILSRGEIDTAPNSPAIVLPFTGAIGRDPNTGFACRLTLINTVASY